MGVSNGFVGVGSLLGGYGLAFAWALADEESAEDEAASLLAILSLERDKTYCVLN